MDLLRERRHEPVDAERAEVEHPPRRIATADPDRDRSVDDGCRRRPRISEPAPPRLGGVGLLGPLARILRSLLERLHQPVQAALLVAPALDGVPEPPLTLLSGL